MNSYGFIITRHVNSEKTNKYWNYSVKYLRKFYPYRRIIIIDDNSNQEYIKSFQEYNITIINSEYKGRGELLPYYYYIKNKFFENAIIIHDSIFFHKRINFDKLNGIKVLPLWHFNEDKENINNTNRIIQNLNNAELLKSTLNLYEHSFDFISYSKNNKKWNGCFGVQTFINHSFLCYIEKKYSITKLIQAVNCRADRCCLERIFGCIFNMEYNINIKSLFGNIMTYQTWGYTIDDYENDIKEGKIPKYIVKIWTGR
jgi:hypothetical protein